MASSLVCSSSSVAVLAFKEGLQGSLAFKVRQNILHDSRVYLPCMEHDRGDVVDVAS